MGSIAEQYFSIGLFLVIALGFAALFVSLGFLRGQYNPYKAKNSPFECGLDAFQEARMPFDTRYYLVAMLFIIFDIEIAFIFPWAVTVGGLGAEGFWHMMVFLGVLTLGLIYEWRKGALEWD